VTNNDPVVVIGVTVGVLLLAYVLLWATVRLARPVRYAGARAASAFTEPISSVFDNLEQDARFERLEDEVQRALGERDQWGDEARSQIVVAAVAAQRINVINQALRKSVNQCLATHWAVAGAGATHMSEAARHPLSRHLRQRVMDLSNLLSQKITAYPLLLDSPELIRLQLGLRWIPATCATCPYWSTTVVEAPRVCPTAKAMAGGNDARKNGAVVDGEIVDNCERDV